MDQSGNPHDPTDGSRTCPTCYTVNPPGATVCASCGSLLPEIPPAAPPGGRTEIISRVPAPAVGRPRLVAPHDLNLGSIRGAAATRGTMRIANNGTGLLTGTLRVAPSAPWLQIVGTGDLVCAAGAVEQVEVEAQGAGMAPGVYTGAVQISSDGGQATVQVSLSVERDSPAALIVAAIITVVLVLGLVGIAWAANGNKLPLVASGATATPTSTSTTLPSPTITASPIPTPTSTMVPTVKPQASPTGASAAKTTATAEALQALVAQRLVASARSTATALVAGINATATVLAVNQSPGANATRQAIEAAVNTFLEVRSRALYAGDGSQLPRVATGRELTDLIKQLADLKHAGEHTKVNSIEAPIWDSVVLDAADPTRAKATLTKHEDELAIRNATGIADDLDPSYKGAKHTLRNQRFAVTYNLINANGAWLVGDYTVFEYPNPLPTPDQNLLPPAVEAPTMAVASATAVAASPSPVPTLPISATPATPEAGVSSTVTVTQTVTAKATVTAAVISVEQVVRQALPSVMRITGSIPKAQQSTGTGFVIESDAAYAYIVTNDHVVNGATNITLSNQSQAALSAVSVQEDTADDLAVIKVAQPAQPLPALAWGDSGTAQLGENVIAIGFALGLKGEPTVSSGIISALHRDVAVRWPYLQHTAPINHGNSGGPLLDQMGRVIGINTLLDENAQSVYFAIPANPAGKMVSSLIAAMP